MGALPRFRRTEVRGLRMLFARWLLCFMLPHFHFHFFQQHEILEADEVGGRSTVGGSEVVDLWCAVVTFDLGIAIGCDHAGVGILEMVIGGDGHCCHRVELVMVAGIDGDSSNWVVVVWVDL